MNGPKLLKWHIPVLTFVWSIPPPPPIFWVENQKVMMTISCLLICRGVCMYRTVETQHLIIKGLPDSLRGEMWMLYSGAINEVGCFSHLSIGGAESSPSPTSSPLLAPPVVLS